MKTEKDIQTTLDILHLNSIYELFDLIIDLYADGKKKLSKAFYNELDKDQQSEAIAYFDASCHFDMLDCDGQEEFTKFIHFIQ